MAFLMTQNNKPVDITPHATKVLVSVAASIITAFLIGTFTMICKMEKLTSTLAYRFTNVTSQVKNHDLKIDEIDRRIRVLEIEVEVAKMRRAR